MQLGQYLYVPEGGKFELLVDMYKDRAAKTTALNPYVELRAAIIEQAFIDLKDSYEKTAKLKKTANRFKNKANFFKRRPKEAAEYYESSRLVEDCERFFRSSWFDAINPLSGISGEDIIKQASKRSKEKTSRTLPYTGENDPK